METILEGVKIVATIIDVIHKTIIFGKFLNRKRKNWAVRKKEVKSSFDLSEIGSEI